MLSRLLARIDLALLTLLVAPLPIFLLMTFEPVVGISATALTLVGAWPAVRALRRTEAQRAIGWLGLLVLIALVGAWVALGGSGHLFAVNGDWLKHDGVFRDLSVMSWPPTYFRLDGHDVVLRYYEGYYAVPAMLTRLVDNPKVWLQAWTTLGVVLVCLRMVFSVRGAGRRLLLVLAFALFGGMDLIGWIIVNGADSITKNLQIESWNYSMWHDRLTMIQFSGSTTLLYWVPQHALGGWIATLLLVGDDRDLRMAPAIPVLLAATAIWTPFAAIGASVLAVPLFLRWLRAVRWRAVLSPALASGALVAMLFAAYITSSSGTNPHGWVWQLNPWRTTVRHLFWFYLLELVLPVLALAWAGARFRTREWCAIATLAVLPLYVYGAWGDLTMRASIPGLLVVFLMLRDAIANRTLRTSPVHLGPLVVVLLIGAYGAVPQFTGAMPYRVEPWKQKETADMLQRLVGIPAGIPPTQYFATEPPWMERIARHHEPVYDISTVEVRQRGWRPMAGDAHAWVPLDGRARVEIGPGSANGSASARTAAGLPAGMYRVTATAHVRGGDGDSRVLLGVQDGEIGFLVYEGKTTGMMEDYLRVDRDGTPVVLQAEGLPAGAIVTLEDLTIQRFTRR